MCMAAALLPGPRRAGAGGLCCGPQAPGPPWSSAAARQGGWWEVRVVGVGQRGCQGSQEKGVWDREVLGVPGMRVCGVRDSEFPSGVMKMSSN